MVAAFGVRGRSSGPRTLQRRGQMTRRDWQTPLLPATFSFRSAIRQRMYRSLDGKAYGPDSFPPAPTNNQKIKDFGSQNAQRATQVPVAGDPGIIILIWILSPCPASGLEIAVGAATTRPLWKPWTMRQKNDEQYIINLRPHLVLVLRESITTSSSRAAIVSRHRHQLVPRHRVPSSPQCPAQAPTPSRPYPCPTRTPALPQRQQQQRATTSTSSHSPAPPSSPRTPRTPPHTTP